MFSFTYNNNDNGNGNGIGIGNDMKYTGITIPKSDLGYKTNNQYPKFPPKMADGRSVISSWQPESAMNEDIIRKNGIASNWIYRKYLTDNSKKIMEENYRQMCNDTGYQLPSYVNSGDKGQSPYTYTSLYDKTQPTGFENSDLKQLYLSREELNSRKVIPVIPIQRKNA
jgi:hypothetical protein